MRLFEFDNKEIELPEHVAAAFVELGNEQRGLPEIAMRKAQTALGGGVLSFVLEHVGDLTHRMSHHAHYGSFYPGIVRDKVEKTLGTLTRGYGFEKEAEENVRSSVSYRQEKDPSLTEEAYRAEVDKRLAAYAQEHAKLPVYNYAQAMARHAAITLGKKNYKATIGALERLQDMFREGDQAFAKHAAEYELDDQGNPKIYTL